MNPTTLPPDIEKEAAAPPRTAANMKPKQGEATISNDRLQGQISVCQIESGRPVQIQSQTAVGRALRDIAIGRWKLEVENVQAMVEKHGKDSDQVKAAKLALPAHTFSGRIEGRQAQAMQEGRFLHSGLMQLDFDKLPNAEATRDLLAEDQHVLAAWISPSGTGLKGLCVIPPATSEEEHKQAFEAVRQYFLERYELDNDKACKNSNRLCFASCDPSMKVNLEAVELPIPATLPVVTSPKPSAASLRTSSRSTYFPAPPENGIHTWLMEAAWHCRLARMSEADTVAKLQSYDGTLRRRLQPTEAADAVRTVFSTSLDKQSGGKSPSGPLPDATIAKQPPQPFAISLASDIKGCSEASDFVEGLLTEAGASVVYGPSNCGKSFWTLDLAASVATGTAFRDELEVDQGAVVYVALEGTHGTRNRIEALRQAGHLPEGTPLFFCFDPVSLLEAGHAPRLAESVKRAAEQSALPCRLVILDTLARAMAGGDENSGQDMTKAVSAIDEVRAATGAHVMVIHHCGKDEAKGARGHSSLRAAVDTEIEVTRPEGQSVSTVRVTKQRDMQPCGPMPFTLASVTLGFSRRGKPITSCTVNHEDKMMATERGKAGRKPTVRPVQLLDLLPQPTTKAWLTTAQEELGVSRTSFYDALSDLRNKGLAKPQTGGGWTK